MEVDDDDLERGLPSPRRPRLRNLFAGCLQRFGGLILWLRQLWPLRTGEAAMRGLIAPPPGSRRARSLRPLFRLASAARTGVRALRTRVGSKLLRGGRGLRRRLLGEQPVAPLVWAPPEDSREVGGGAAGSGGGSTGGGASGGSASDGEDRGFATLHIAQIGRPTVRGGADAAPPPQPPLPLPPLTHPAGAACETAHAGASAAFSTTSAITVAPPTAASSLSSDGCGSSPARPPKPQPPLPFSPTPLRSAPLGMRHRAGAEAEIVSGGGGGGGGSSSSSSSSTSSGIAQQAGLLQHRHFDTTEPLFLQVDGEAYKLYAPAWLTIDHIGRVELVTAL